MSGSEDEGGEVDVVYFDFSKAFGTIFRSIFMPNWWDMVWMDDSKLGGNLAG